jgi:hypothetical protein
MHSNFKFTITFTFNDCLVIASTEGARQSNGWLRSLHSLAMTETFFNEVDLKNFGGYCIHLVVQK